MAVLAGSYLLVWKNRIDGVVTASTSSGSNQFTAGQWLHAATVVPPATGTGTRTTVAFSTTGPATVVAFVSADGPAGAGRQAATVSGAGLSWTLALRSNSQPGDAEIWTATAPAALDQVTVTSSLSRGGYHQALTVVAFANATGAGAAAANAAADGPPTVSVTTTAPFALVYAVGHGDHAAARAPGPGQTLVGQWLDTSVSATSWTQATTDPVTAAGTVVTLDDTAPTVGRWNYAAIEITGRGGDTGMARGGVG